MFRSPLSLLLALVAAPALAADAPAPPECPSYQKHVTALFSRLGCNGGTCHGAVKGQSGFRLSLFGGDPAADHANLLREFGGRRLNVQTPTASLLLRKATGEAEHGGGVRLRPDSFEYEVFRRWVAAGAPADLPAPARVKELRVTPAEQVAKPGESYRLKVEARFADDTTEDVTAYCSFQSLDTATAAVNAAGQVTAKSVGEAPLMVRYRAHPALARVLVPPPASGAFPDVKPQNFVDAHVLAKLPHEPAADPARGRRDVPPPRLSRCHRRIANAGRRAGIPGGFVPRQAGAEDRRVAHAARSRSLVDPQVLRPAQGRRLRCVCRRAFPGSRRTAVSGVGPSPHGREHALRRVRGTHPARHQPRGPDR